MQTKRPGYNYGGLKIAHSTSALHLSPGPCLFLGCIILEYSATLCKLLWPLTLAVPAGSQHIYMPWTRLGAKHSKKHLASTNWRLQPILSSNIPFQPSLQSGLCVILFLSLLSADQNIGHHWFLIAISLMPYDLLLLAMANTSIHPYAYTQIGVVCQGLAISVSLRCVPTSTGR